MLFELIVFGGMAFWVIFIIFSIVIIVSLENDVNPGGIAISLMIFLLALILFTDFWVIFADRPVISILYAIGAYVLGGVLWAMPKWFFLLLSLRRNLVAMKEELFNRYGISGPQVPDKLMEIYSEMIFDNDEFRKYGLGYSIEEKRIIPPRFSKNRERVMIWMCFWPWNAFWTLLKNPIRWFFEAVLDVLQTIFQKISNILFSGFNDNPLPPVDAESDIAVGEDPDDSADAK